MAKFLIFASKWIVTEKLNIKQNDQASNAIQIAHQVIIFFLQYSAVLF